MKLFDFEKAKENAQTAFKLLPELTESINTLAVACALTDEEKRKNILISLLNQVPK
mgnify:CR=1 FL=1